MTVLMLMLIASLAHAQDFSGVWRFDPKQSKTTGPGPQRLLILIEHKSSSVHHRALAFERDGREQRMEFRFDTTGAETQNGMRGVPVRSRARMEGAVLVTDSSMRITNPPMDVVVTERWSLGPDSTSLNVERTVRRNGAESVETLRFERGTAADAEEVNRPEKNAGENYRNIQVLKSIPSSRLMEIMINLQPALGVKCDHCHIPNEWYRDDKPSKSTARAMFVMTQSLNRDHFAGRDAVQCNTCHRGAPKPQ